MRSENTLTITDKLKRLKKRAERRRREELKELRDLILLENEWAKDDWLWMSFNWGYDKVLLIDVDEKYYTLNGGRLEEWLNNNTDCTTTSDKTFIVHSINKK